MLKLHNNSRGAKFTKGKKWKLVYYKNYESKKKAMQEDVRALHAFVAVCIVCVTVVQQYYAMVTPSPLGDNQLGRQIDKHVVHRHYVC